jgi:hypothetical protein
MSDDDGDDGLRRDLFIDRTWEVFVIKEWKARDGRDDGRRDAIPFIMEWMNSKQLIKIYIIICYFDQLTLRLLHD